MVDFIKGAIKKPGALTKQAKKAGMSVKSFESKVLKNPKNYSATTVRRANLSKTLRKVRKKK
tara:strand:+ start:73 stop:258 length:186 start_codon:yes stop_codon:yes gene_type:complete